MGRINVPIMGISLVASIGFWFLAYGQNLADDEKIPITLTNKNIYNLPSQFYVDTDSEGALGRVLLELNGTHDAVERVLAMPDLDKEIRIDLTNAGEGKALYPLAFNNSSIKTLVSNPPRIALTIERKITRPIVVRAVGINKLKDADAFSLTEMRKSADRASVNGPPSIVRQISYLSAYVDLSQINPESPTTQSDISLKPFDANGNPVPTESLTITPSTVSITPKAEPVSASKPVVVSPVFIGAPPHGFLFRGYQIEPSQVTLHGDNLKVAGTTEIKTEKVDLSGLMATKTFRVKLQLLSGAYPTPSSVSVTVTVGPDSQTQVSPNANVNNGPTAYPPNGGVIPPP